MLHLRARRDTTYHGTNDLQGWRRRLATGITFYRKRRNLTQAALAGKLGVDGGTMSRIESGDLIPSSVQVDKLVLLLGTPPSYLFSEHVLNEVADRERAAS